MNRVVSYIALVVCAAAACPAAAQSSTPLPCFCPFQDDCLNSGSEGFCEGDMMWCDGGWGNCADGFDVAGFTSVFKTCRFVIGATGTVGPCGIPGANQVQTACRRSAGGTTQCCYIEKTDMFEITTGYGNVMIPSGEVSPCSAGS